jgi:hypothetical protein
MRTQYHARAIHFHDKIGVSRIISVLGSLTFGAIHSALTDIRSRREDFDAVGRPHLLGHLITLTWSHLLGRAQRQFKTATR